MFGAEPHSRGAYWVGLSPQNSAYQTVGWTHTHPNPGFGPEGEQFTGKVIMADGRIGGDGAVTVAWGVPGYLYFRTYTLLCTYALDKPHLAVYTTNCRPALN